MPTQRELGINARAMGISPRQMREREQAQMMPVETLKVTYYESIANGVSKDGRPWTIYVVEAERENGDPVDEVLKSWDRLPLDELLAYKVDLRPDPRFGPAYWLSGHGLEDLSVPKLAALVGQQAERIVALERQVAKLEQLVALL